MIRGLAGNSVLAFTIGHSGFSNKLISKVSVSPHDNANTSGIVTTQEPSLNGLWDTGATCSVITQNVVDSLSLKPIRYGFVSTPSGEYETSFYYVDIGLPNHVIVGPLLVPLGKPSGCDVLIGMDVIMSGDFAVSNYNGSTTFTFRVPSIETTDYVKKARISSLLGPKHGKGKKNKKQ